MHILKKHLQNLPSRLNTVAPHPPLSKSHMGVRPPPYGVGGAPHSLRGGAVAAPPLTECTCYLKRSLRICGPNCSPYGIGGAPDSLSKKGGCTLTGSGVGPRRHLLLFFQSAARSLADKCKIRLRKVWSFKSKVIVSRHCQFNCQCRTDL